MLFLALFIRLHLSSSLPQFLRPRLSINTFKAMQTSICIHTTLTLEQPLVPRYSLSLTPCCVREHANMRRRDGKKVGRLLLSRGVLSVNRCAPAPIDLSTSSPLVAAGSGRKLGKIGSPHSPGLMGIRLVCGPGPGNVCQRAKSEKSHPGQKIDTPHRDDLETNRFGWKTRHIPLGIRGLGN